MTPLSVTNAVARYLLMRKSGATSGVTCSECAVPKAHSAAQRLARERCAIGVGSDRSTATVHESARRRSYGYLAHHQQQAEPAELVPPKGQNASPSAVASSLRVLVVDDNRDAVTTLGTLLQVLGNEVRTAEDGLEAVARAEAFRPDVALLNIGLPKLDGYAAECIRRQSWGKGMVLIALASWGQEVDKRRSQEAGFDQQLVKPADPATLVQLLASCQHDRGSGV